MTKEEIISALDAVGNQGNQLDLTGKLIDTLKEAVNLIPEGGGGDGVKTVRLVHDSVQTTKYRCLDTKYNTIKELAADFALGKVRIIVDDSTLTDGIGSSYAIVQANNSYGYLILLNSDEEGAQLEPYSIDNNRIIFGE